MRGARKKGDRTGTRGMHSARDPRGTWHSVQVSNIRGETPNTAIPFPLSISLSCSLLDPPHSLPSLVSFLFWLNIAVSGVVYPPFVSFRSFSTLQTQSSLLLPPSSLRSKFEPLPQKNFFCFQQIFLLLLLRGGEGEGRGGEGKKRDESSKFSFFSLFQSLDLVKF